MSILCNHSSIKDGSSILVPVKENKTSLEYEMKLIKKAQAFAVLHDKENNEDVEAIIEKLERLQKSNGSSSSEPSASKTNEQMGKSKMLSQTQFFAIIVHLAGAEIRFMLDTTSRDISENEKQSLPLLFSLLQETIKVLIDEDLCPDMDRSLDFVSSLKTSLHDTFMATSAFLAERWDLFEESGNVDESLLDNIFTLHCFAAYSAWVDVEPNTDEDEIERLVPFLVWLQKRG